MISGEGKLFDLVRCDSDEAWREERRKGIGGSDVAAIMGLSAYRTPYQVWLDKVEGIHDDISEKPAVIWGNILEHIIGEYYASQHPDRSVRRVNGMMRSIARPWAQASLDYEVRDPELGWGILECKTAGWRREDDWSDGVPTYYQTQCAHYMSITGREFADVAVLIAGNDYREYRLVRDEEDIAVVNSAVDSFWKDYIVAGVQPDVNEIDGSSVFLAHKKSGGDFIESDSIPYEISRWIIAKGELDSAKHEYQRWSSKVKALVGDAAGFRTPSGTLTWVRSNKTRVDTKRLRAELPEIAESYSTTDISDMGLRWREPREQR